MHAQHAALDKARTAVHTLACEECDSSLIQPNSCLSYTQLSAEEKCEYGSTTLHLTATQAAYKYT